MSSHTPRIALTSRGGQSRLSGEGRILPGDRALKANMQPLQEMPSPIEREHSYSPAEDSFVKSEDLAKEPTNLDTAHSEERADLYWEAFKGHPDRLAQSVRARHQPKIEQWKQSQELAALSKWMKSQASKTFKAWKKSEAPIGLMAWMEQNHPGQLQEWQQQHYQAEIADWKQSWKQTANRQELGSWLQENHQDVVVQFIQQDQEEQFNQWIQEEHFDVLSQWGGGYPKELKQRDLNRLTQLWMQDGQQTMFQNWLKKKHRAVFKKWDAHLEKWLKENPRAVLKFSAEARNEKLFRQWVTQSRQNIQVGGLPKGPDGWLKVADLDSSELIALDEGFKQEKLRQQFEKRPLEERNPEFLVYSQDGKWAKAVAMLSAGGVDINQGERDEESIPDETGTTVLMRAATSKNCIQIMRGLLAEGADVNQKDALLGETALFYAILAGHDEVVDFLIQNQADVNEPNILGTTPLMAAAGLGREKIVRSLIQAGADVNVQRHSTLPADETLTDPAFDIQNGETALTQAAKSRNPEVVKILLEAGATMGSITDYGSSGQAENELFANQAMKERHINNLVRAAQKKLTKTVLPRQKKETPANKEQGISKACLLVCECLIHPIRFLRMGFRTCFEKLQEMDRRTNSDSTHMSSAQNAHQQGCELSEI